MKTSFKIYVHEVCVHVSSFVCAHTHACKNEGSVLSHHTCLFFRASLGA